MPFFEDKRVNHRKQELRCCVTCPHAFFDEKNLLKCSIVHKEENRNKSYIKVGHTDICDMYPKLKFPEE